MKCPKCAKELVAAERHGIQVDYCSACRGMWLDPQELDQLEDQVFSDDALKGTVVALPTPSSAVCPHCSKALQKFKYRFYDLSLEHCEEHGFWLDAGEDLRVLELMKRSEQNLEHKVRAEAAFAGMLQKWRTPTFLGRLRDLFSR